MLRTIRHDAIVAYDGVFRDENGRLYLVMEFVDGPSLSKVIKQGALPPAQVRQLRDRLADGLAAAHEKGVIHRDLSPDNVILPGGDLTKAKIIDFGISKMADPEAKTIVGDDFAGKYSYVSPEQVGLYGGKVDPRSDIYSLGLVLAAAAMRRAPRHGVVADLGDRGAAGGPEAGARAGGAAARADRHAAARSRRPAAVAARPGARGRATGPRAETRSGKRRRDGDRAAIRSRRDAACEWPSSSAPWSLLLAVGGGLGYWLLAPTPVPPVPMPQPPQLDKIALLTAAADAALQGFQCAELSAHVSQSGDIDVTGYVASPSRQASKSTAQLASLPRCRPRQQSAGGDEAAAVRGAGHPARPDLVAAERSRCAADRSRRSARHLLHGSGPPEAWRHGAASL